MLTCGRLATADSSIKLDTYNPLTDPPTVVVNEEKAQHWLGVGAKPTDTVQRIFQTQGVVEKAG